jgi:hypothetical protein
MNQKSQVYFLAFLKVVGIFFGLVVLFIFAGTSVLKEIAIGDNGPATDSRRNLFGNVPMGNLEQIDFTSELGTFSSGKEFETEAAIAAPTSAPTPPYTAGGYFVMESFSSSNCAKYSLLKANIFPFGACFPADENGDTFATYKFSQQTATSMNYLVTYYKDSKCTLYADKKAYLTEPTQCQLQIDGVVIDNLNNYELLRYSPTFPVFDMPGAIYV